MTFFLFFVFFVCAINFPRKMDGNSMHGWMGDGTVGSMKMAGIDFPCTSSRRGGVIMEGRVKQPRPCR